MIKAQIEMERLIVDALEDLLAKIELKISKHLQDPSYQQIVSGWIAAKGQLKLIYDNRKRYLELLESGKL